MNRALVRIRAAGAGGPTTRSWDPDGFCRETRFFPRFTGHVRFLAVPADYLARLQRRVAEGFLAPGSLARNNYVSQPLPDGGIKILAHDYLTAVNVGLNEVAIRRKDAQCVQFEVRYSTWHRSVVFGSAMLLGIAAALFVGFRTWSDLNGVPPTALNLAAGLFFGLCWPWVLTEGHKKPAARCITRILRETLSD